MVKRVKQRLSNLLDVAGALIECPSKTTLNGVIAAKRTLVI